MAHINRSKNMIIATSYDEFVELFLPGLARDRGGSSGRNAAIELESSSFKISSELANSISKAVGKSTKKRTKSVQGT